MSGMFCLCVKNSQPSKTKISPKQQGEGEQAQGEAARWCLSGTGAWDMTQAFTHLLFALPVVTSLTQPGGRSGNVSRVPVDFMESQKQSVFLLTQIMKESRKLLMPVFSPSNVNAAG